MDVKRFWGQAIDDKNTCKWSGAGVQLLAAIGRVTCSCEVAELLQSNVIDEPASAATAVQAPAHSSQR